MIISDSRPKLVMTMGDPAGIGPEIILKALYDPNIHQFCQLTVVGSRSVLQKTYLELKQLGKPAASQSHSH